jgi:CspA family cold shock protein
MGSDGFESKKLGGPPGGTGPNRLGPGEFSGNAERDPAIDAFSGLGDTATNLVEISGVIKWFDA